MGRYRPYAAEVLLILLTTSIGVLGFWGIYVGPRADPQPHHHLHVVTTFGWIGLLLAQIALLARGKWASHSRLGLGVLLAGPLLVASAALLTVHSARSAIILVIVTFFFPKDRRNNWPYLLAAASYLLGELGKATLAPLDLIDPLTQLVAAPSEAAAFIVTLAIVSALLIGTVLPRGAGRASSKRGEITSNRSA